MPTPVLSAVPTTELAGWGANLRAACHLVQPSSPLDVRGLLDPAGTVARGLGRSYGDCAINAGKQVIGTTAMDRFLAFDPWTGI